MVTAETAVVLPVLVMLLALLLGVLGHAVDQARMVDAARSGARAAARGESIDEVRRVVLDEAPDGISVSVHQSATEVSVEVTAPSRSLFGLLALPAPSAESVALLEAGGVP